MSDQSPASPASPATVRPVLLKLAVEQESITTRRLWKALSLAERTQAIVASLKADENGWVKPRVQTTLVKAKRYRPQTVAPMNAQKLASELASAPVEDTALLDAFLVDLHFAHRRDMMGDFLNLLGIPHEGGKLPEDTSSIAPTPGQLRASADALVARYPADEVYVYFLVLVLQSRATWSTLGDWLAERSRAV